jgi:predicted nuclease of predicted toxin-antitoxin system
LTDPPAGSSFRFLFDEHVNAKAMERLRDGGVDVLSVAEIGLAGADDGTVFDRARRDGRIVVTRNDQDFAPLVTEAGRRAISFPGVLFLARSLSQADVDGHVRGLEQWIASAREKGANPVEGTFGWLSLSGVKDR